MNVEKERWLSLTLWLTNILTTLPAGVTRDIFKVERRIRNEISAVSKICNGIERFP